MREQKEFNKRSPIDIKKNALIDSLTELYLKNDAERLFEECTKRDDSRKDDDVNE